MSGIGDSDMDSFLIRDVFAAAALTGILAGRLVEGRKSDKLPPTHPDFLDVSDCALFAYRMADAMIAQRTK